MLCWLVFRFCAEIQAQTASSWQQGEHCRYLQTPALTEHKPGFTRLGFETGVQFTNVLGVGRYTTNQIYLNGSGVAAGDVDGDGFCDFFLPGLDGPNALFRNLGDWHFQNIAVAAGVALPELDCTGAALADLDGDGDLDLVLNTVGQGTHIFFNDGKGRFSRVALLNPSRAGMSIALADIDSDGDLDLYVANYRTTTIRDDPFAQIRGDYVKGKPVPIAYNDRSLTNADLVGRFTFGANGKIIEHGEVDVLFRNDGGGKFTPLSFTDGTFTDEHGKPLQTLPFDWGLSCMFHDINGDGAPDLYVCNDFESPDRIWINNGKGQFRAISTAQIRHTSMFSMGVDFADINRDGFVDFFVADMLSRHHTDRQVRIGQVPPYVHNPGEIDLRPQYSQNTFYLNRGDNTFAEISWFSHLEASEWSWTPAFIDVDLDGYEDLLITTGHQLEMMNSDVIKQAEVLKTQKKMTRLELLNMKNLFSRMDTPHLAFRNNRDLTFTEMQNEWGFSDSAVSHGLAFADLDNDGDLDVIINNLNSLATIYRNDCSAPRVAIRLKGLSPNTRGIGAKIKVVGGPVEQSQEMICGGRYLSSDDPMRVFAAGTNGNPMRLQVTWRNGKQTIVENVLPNRIYEIEEQGSSGKVPTTSSPSPPEGGEGRGEEVSPLFEDRSQLLSHTHTEEPFDDFQRQPLLPMRLSQLGPGVGWHDYDQDGFDDLAVASGRGGKFSIYHNDGKGGFTPLNDPIFQRTIARDQTTVLGLDNAFIAGSSNWEDGTTNGGWARIYDLGRKVAGEIILGPEASTGPMTMADVDGDGKLELFIGGRAIPGKYPEAATSLLLRNDNGRFVVKQRFEKLGLVSGALFSDLDNDGSPELILACHWGPIRVFHNDKGAFREITAELGLADLKGFWNGIATGDFDGDGKLDIIASNWGLNTPFKASAQYPLKLYYGDFDGNGFTDLVEARFDPEMNKEVPQRSLRTVGLAMPFVQEKMRTYQAYGKASVQEIYGDKLKDYMEVTTLATTLFLNRGDKFETHPLPAEAQFSPAFGICVADLDGDGNEDVFLSQNFFATNPEMPRADAGRGLLLRGDGQGNLTPVHGQQSGIKVYGEQRGCALSDYDHDGRIDLAVSQNAAPTKLFHNLKAKPGLRVRFEGAPGNKDMIGAKLRLKFDHRLAPVREIQCGSGYWSQNSPMQILATPEPPTELLVQLPGGKMATNAIPPESKEIRLDRNGQKFP
jgi:hypothetical protein